LYRERIRCMPPWNHQAVVVLAFWGAAAACGSGGVALVAFAAALLPISQVAWKRLRHTSHAPAHVVEMLSTSALIPFLSAYRRLRGAWRFRVLFL
jgi:hypothetical protein